MNDISIPIWWSMGLVVVGLYGIYNTYKQLSSGVVSGGKVAIWNRVRYYDRETQPKMFWFMAILGLGGALACLATGLFFLLVT